MLATTMPGWSLQCHRGKEFTNACSFPLDCVYMLFLSPSSFFLDRRMLLKEHNALLKGGGVSFADDFWLSDPL